jgi:hypothetical protein
MTFKKTFSAAWLAISAVVMLGLGVASLPAQTSPANPDLGMAPMQTLTGEWKPLFDEKFTQWEKWVGAPYDTNLDKSTGGKVKSKAQPYGLNNDPRHVFNFEMTSGEPVLHITGEVYGGFTTLAAYANYHLRIQVKWGARKWPPKQRALRDSGLLFHCTGPHGVSGNEFKCWKRSFEFQVEDTDCADLFFLRGTHADVPVKIDAEDPMHIEYDPNGKLVNFKTKTSGGRIRHLPGSYESPLGEWTTLELYTLGRTAVFVVNGHVLQVLRNTAVELQKDRPLYPLTAGQIQLQSEGAEVFYRRAEIQGITAYPPEILEAAKFKPADLVPSP